MKGPEVRRVRDLLALSQGDLGGLLGVDARTVWRWEKGVTEPSPYASALLASFERSERHAPGTGRVAALALHALGVPTALYALLSPSCEPKRAPRGRA